MAIDRDLLEAALIGYQAEIDRIEGVMAAVKAQLNGGAGAPEPVTEASGPRKKRTMSPAARKRIAAAQKKRWADFHAAKG